MRSLRPEQFDDAGDLAACEAMLCGGSRTFYAASRLLPRAVRVPASGLYAFCRVADDIVDLSPDRDPVGVLRRRVDRIFAGQPESELADRALTEVVSRYPIPRSVVDAMLEGFAWDAAGKQYETYSDVVAYSARVAGTVGVMMAVIMGARSRDALARACDLGIAMQLTNIARDVGEDARVGRLYLPRDWMRDAGLDPDCWLTNPSYCPALGRVVSRLLDEAALLYERAESGIMQLPADCRPAIMTARYLYAEIGNEVRRRGFDSVTQRAVVPMARKLLLFGYAIWVSRGAASVFSYPPLPEAAFLVDACVSRKGSLARKTERIEL